MSRVGDFWKELLTPEAFSDPYSEATNQLSHMALGVALSLGVCVLYHAAFGELPARIFLWVGLIFAYFLVIEIWLQRAGGKDSLADTAFVGMGSTMSLWPAKEVGLDGGLVLIAFNAPLLGWLLLGSVSALGVHLWWSFRRV